MSNPRFAYLADGSIATESTLDAIAKAFGFNSAAHMDAVAAGREPSAMDNRQVFYARKRLAS